MCLRREMGVRMYFPRQPMVLVQAIKIHRLPQRNDGAFSLELLSHQDQAGVQK